MRSAVRRLLNLLGLLVCLAFLQSTSSRAEIACSVGQGHLKFGAVADRSQELAIGEFSISCLNLGAEREAAKVTVYLSGANNYKLDNQRNEGSLEVRVYSDDTFTVPLGTSGEGTVLLTRILELGGGGAEQIIMPIYASLEVGEHPIVGDYTGTLSIELKLDPVGIGEAAE